eukprot:36123-Pyramimonas_sp.AAC.1
MAQPIMLLKSSSVLGPQPRCNTYDCRWARSAGAGGSVGSAAHSTHGGIGRSSTTAACLLP